MIAIIVRVVSITLSSCIFSCCSGGYKLFLCGFGLYSYVIVWDMSSSLFLKKILQKIYFDLPLVHAISVLFITVPEIFYKFLASLGDALCLTKLYFLSFLLHGWVWVKTIYFLFVLFLLLNSIIYMLCTQFYLFYESLSMKS